LVNWGKKNFEMRVKSGKKMHDCKEFLLAEASLSLIMPLQKLEEKRDLYIEHYNDQV